MTKTYAWWVPLLFAAGQAVAAESKTLCVYDPSGANGDAFNLAKDYRTAATGWGAELTLKPYTDEKTASEDFKGGKCDAVLLTGVRARNFNRFAGTVEALGAMPDYNAIGQVIKTLASPKGGALLKGADYSVLGIFPAGSVFLFTTDKAIDTVGKMAGKKIATLEYDEAAKAMVRQVGASLVAADIGTFAGMFNNGSVDLCYAPTVAYKALELNKGIGKKGGIARYVLSQLTLQMVARTSAFSDDFATKSRQWSADNFDRMKAILEKADAAVPKDQWIEVPKEAREKYDQVFQEVRLRLRDSEKVYDKSMLTLLRRVRCKADAARAECSEQKE